MDVRNKKRAWMEEEEKAPADRRQGMMMTKHFLWPRPNPSYTRLCLSLILSFSSLRVRCFSLPSSLARQKNPHLIPHWPQKLNNGKEGFLVFLFFSFLPALRNKAGRARTHVAFQKQALTDSRKTLMNGVNGWRETYVEKCVEQLLACTYWRGICLCQIIIEYPSIFVSIAKSWKVVFVFCL